MDKQVAKTIDAFFAPFTKLVYRKGETILRSEESPAGVLYLKRGFVRLYHVSETGNTLMLHVFKPGSFFPMTWLVSDIPNRYYYEAVGPVEIWRAPKDDVKAFLATHPEVLSDFTGRILSGVSGLLTRMEHLVLASAYTKTIQLLVYFAKSFREKETDGIMLRMPLTHREIAAWIGTTRETASLQIETLKRKGLIVYKGRKLIIPDIKKLEAEAAKKE